MPLLSTRLPRVNDVSHRGGAARTRVRSLCSAPPALLTLLLHALGASHGLPPIAGRIVPLAVSTAHAAAAGSLGLAPLALLRAPLGPLLLPVLGAQGVVPVRRPGQWPLTHDSLGARVRLLYPHSQSP